MKRRINRDERLLLDLRRALTVAIKAMRRADRLDEQVAVLKQDLKAAKGAELARAQVEALHEDTRTLHAFVDAIRTPPEGP